MDDNTGIFDIKFAFIHPHSNSWLQVGGRLLLIGILCFGSIFCGQRPKEINQINTSIRLM
jgi:hypothetical protein